MTGTGARVLIGLALLVAGAGGAGAQGFNPNEIERDATLTIAEARLNSMCLSTFPPGVATPVTDDSFADCRCAAEAYVAARGAEEARDLDEKAAMSGLGSYIAGCRAERTGSSAKPSVMDIPPPVVGASPIGSDAPTTEAAEAPVQEVTPRVQIVPESERSGGGLLAWLGRSGLPLWVWVLLPIAAGAAGLVVMARRGKTG